MRPPIRRMQPVSARASRARERCRSLVPAWGGSRPVSWRSPCPFAMTSEYKINLLASATSGLVARGEVVKAGRTLTVARAEVYADDRTHIATMQQTLMMLPGRTDHRE